MPALSVVTSETPVTSSEPTFADFWLLYPRRVAKKDAEKAWSKLSPTDRVSALVGLVDWRRVWITRDEMEYVPYPATWLNGERWTDELPATCSHASHAPVKPREDEPKGEMPDSVRALIAKMRKG